MRDMLCGSPMLIWLDDSTSSSSQLKQVQQYEAAWEEQGGRKVDGV